MLDQSLTKEEWEKALRVVYQAWETADGEIVQARIPEDLQHLEQEDWEEVCQVLSVLEFQQSISSVH